MWERLRDVCSRLKAIQLNGSNCKRNNPLTGKSLPLWAPSLTVSLSSHQGPDPLPLPRPSWRRSFLFSLHLRCSLPSVGDLFYALGFTTTQTTYSSHLCSSPEVICLDSSLSSPTQLLQSLIHFLPDPPFPKHSIPSSSCILCLGTTTCPTNLVRNLGVILDFPQLYPVSLEVFSSLALKCILFFSSPWLVVALTTHTLDHWQWVVSGLRSPCQCAPPPLAAVANTPLSKMFYLLLQLETFFWFLRACRIIA